MSNKKYTNYFLHSQSSFSAVGKVNIILSPEFYWAKVFDLPMNSNKEVLNVLPNLFEEFVETSDLKYYVKKLEDNKYLCFAYNEETIISQIKKSGLTVSQVSSIHFGQVEFESIVKSAGQTCMKVDGVCLSFINDLLVQIPLKLRVEIDNNVSIDDIELSKDKIYINSGSKYIDIKSTYILSIIFLLFSMIIFSKIIDNSSVISSIPEKIDTIKNQSNMPSTTIQAKSIIKKIKRTVVKQGKIREAYSYIFKIQKTLGGRMISLSFKDEQFVIKFKELDAKKLTTYLEKKYILNSAVVKDGIVTIGLKL